MIKEMVECINYYYRWVLQRSCCLCSIYACVCVCVVRCCVRFIRHRMFGIWTRATPYQEHVQLFSGPAARSIDEYFPEVPYQCLFIFYFIFSFILKSENKVPMNSVDRPTWLWTRQSRSEILGWNSDSLFCTVSSSLCLYPVYIEIGNENNRGNNHDARWRAPAVDFSPNFETKDQKRSSTPVSIIKRLQMETDKKQHQGQSIFN